MLHNNDLLSRSAWSPPRQAETPASVRFFRLSSDSFPSDASVMVSVSRPLVLCPAFPGGWSSGLAPRRCSLRNRRRQLLPVPSSTRPRGVRDRVTSRPVSLRGDLSARADRRASLLGHSWGTRRYCHAVAGVARSVDPIAHRRQASISARSAAGEAPNCGTWPRTRFANNRRRRCRRARRIRAVEGGRRSAARVAPPRHCRAAAIVLSGSIRRAPSPAQCAELRCSSTTAVRRAALWRRAAATPSRPSSSC
jgi:hypothetical protein